MPDSRQQPAENILAAWTPAPIPNKGGRPATKQYNEPAFTAQPLDTHVERLRYKAAYNANLVADDMARELGKPQSKRNYNAIRNMSITFGVLTDKAAQGNKGDSLIIRFPSQALDALKIGVAIQVRQLPQPPAITATLADDPE